MKEYLETTTLGDLMRKAKDIEIVPQANVTDFAQTPTQTESVASSVIRNSPIGEINQ